MFLCLCHYLFLCTAAHCVDRPFGRPLMPSDISALLGAHDINQNEIGQISIPAEFIRIHEKWNSSSDEYNNDVALIKLREIVKFNKFVRPVCLPTAEITTIEIGIIVGWGAYDDNLVTSNIPREVKIPFLKPFDCAKKNQLLLSAFDESSIPE